MLELQLAWCGALALPLAKGPALALQGIKPDLCSFGSAMGSVDWTAAEWASWDPRWSEQQWAEFLGDSLDVPHEEEAPPPPPPAAAEQRKRGPESLGEAESARPASVPRNVGPAHTRLRHLGLGQGRLLWRRLQCLLRLRRQEPCRSLVVALDFNFTGSIGQPS